MFFQYTSKTRNLMKDRLKFEHILMHLGGKNKISFFFQKNIAYCRKKSGVSLFDTRVSVYKSRSALAPSQVWTS